MMMRSPMGYPGMGYQQLGASNPTEAALQRAVVALGMLVNDAKLALKVDGIVGPGTAAAVNRAMAAYATSAPANARTGKLTVATVKAQAAALTNLIAQEINKRQKGKPGAAPKPSAAPPTANKAAAQTLQRAVATLGAQRNDATLKIAADGAVGPKTVAAVNKALTRYVPSSPANMRTGKLTTAQVQSNAATIATYIEREIAAFKNKPAGTAQTAKTSAPPSGVSKAVALGLQNSLRALGTVTKDAVLKIAADGVIGPRTVTAANRALTTYLKRAATDINGVRANAATLTAMFSTEAAKRGSAAISKVTAVTQSASQPGGTANLTIARMQRALKDFGVLINDSVLKITADGIVGPKTAAAVNKTFTSYIKDAPAGLKQKLSTAQIASMADVITAQVEKAVSARRALSARAQSKGEKLPSPPEAVQDVTEETYAEEAQAPSSAPVPQAPSSAPSAMPGPQIVPQEPSYTAPQAPAATYTPPAASSSDYANMMPPSAPGGGEGSSSRAMAPVAPSEGQEAAPVPGADVPAPDEKKFPWLLVGIGAGVVVIGGITIIAFSKKKKPARRLAHA